MEEKKWYVVNTYSGHESKVKEKLDMRINSMEMQENIFRVIVPERKEVEIKDGKKKEKQFGGFEEIMYPCRKINSDYE